MISGRDAARVLVPLALHAAAREVDRATGVLLHTTLDLDDFVPQALQLVDPTTVLESIALWCGAGFVLWLALARTGAARPSIALPLLLRPALTLLALIALAIQPVYPYGFTLPVALTQDWGIAQDIAAAAAVVTAVEWRGAGWRVPAPGAISVSFAAFVAYALLSPQGALRWENHAGNEPKTLRMAVALGHRLSLDVEPVSAAMEDLPVDAPATAIGRALGTIATEGARMIAAGPAAFRRDAIRATRVTRQTVRGKDGGVFHVLAPGPSLLLAPTLRLDRFLNRREGRTGRLAFSILWWNALGALLVGALFALVRDATGRPGLSTAIAAFAALTPPFLFYFFQFYPEMLGTLAFAVLLRALVFRAWWTVPHAWAMGALLAALPWLHQKFLPAWAVLAAWAILKLVGEMAPARGLAGIALPQAASLLLFAVYNFAITGCARPDALFLAWGPGGVSGERVGQGLLGLLLDARYGVVPYVPVLLLAVAGLFLRGNPLLRALPAMAVYYATVAAADNWSGAVCSLGRYFMPAAPFAIALAAVAVGRAMDRPAVRAVALALAGWSALLAWLLWHDFHAADDCWLLLARSAFADGNVYLPNLFIRAWADAAPGLWARVAAWVALAVLAGWWTARARTRDAARALAAGMALLLVLAFALERWPSPRRAADFPDAVEIAPGVTAFLDDGELLVRARAPIASVAVRATGEGVVRIRGAAPFLASPAGTTADVPLLEIAHLTGRRGVEERLYRQAIEASGAVSLAVVPR